MINVKQQKMTKINIKKGKCIESFSLQVLHSQFFGNNGQFLIIFENKPFTLQ